MSKELWSPPNIGIININFDTSFQSDSRNSITPVLARNFESEIVGASPPNIGIIKINFDASFQSDSRNFITSVLARNLESEIVGACTYLFEDVVDAFVAEARVCERVCFLRLKWVFDVFSWKGTPFLFLVRLTEQLAP